MWMGKGPSGMRGLGSDEHPFMGPAVFRSLWSSGVMRVKIEACKGPCGAGGQGGLPGGDRA